MYEKTLLVSIIIPTFNRAHTLKRAINSVLYQTYRPLELIIIDDCSMDSTIQLLKNFDFKDVDFQILNNEKNLGIGRSRNLGIKSANGDYLAFLDSDDEWNNPDKIKLQVDFLINNPDYGFVSTAWDREGIRFERNKSYFSDDDSFRNIALFYCPALTSTWLFKKSLTLKAGYFWPARTEDYEYLLRIGKFTKCYSINSVCLLGHPTVNGDYNSNKLFSGLIAIYICILYGNIYPHFFKAIFLRCCRGIRILNIFH